MPAATQDASAAPVPPPPGPAGWRFAARCLPDTLFGRLALLLFVAVLASHVLALTLMFELRPGSGPGLRHGPPAAADWPGGGQGGSEPPLPPQARHPPGWWHPGLLLDIGVRLAALMLAAWWGARWLARPLRRLATAARQLGADIHRPPLPEDGTAECREASRVFNQMQARIRRQLDERDRFVAAVSHDLRTPLTRLRLRAESLGQDAERTAFARDIAEMDAMIAATLDHLRGVAGAEPLALLDVQALLESLVDDEQACGHEVHCSGIARPLPARAGALRRCLDNLVGNAVRYGGSAEVALEDAPDALRIHVRDHGPGLPPDELGRVVQPFYRVETSRNRHSGGAGLGLSIASDIVQRHGGSLLLSNAAGGGLRATVVLPRPDDPGAPGHVPA
ncbi:ATP-binding protein [Paracidovorax cattleyae]|uniref:histidine kinase n=1 Tax=Paracidovorax cattleyae TaxID=80868 RepID=A0A1H0NWA0_9BURK|nr:ATP-binding protein [Paracidovorax cattleyae]AVS75140.1 HAMP domain-containing protein [Paracidovorax cattleyae]SDO96798.1 protein-histidine pros-kinase [Paracidovorax cattleyae]